MPPVNLGIFAKTFPRATVEEVFAAVGASGLRCVQFNFQSAGIPTMADAYPVLLLKRVQRAAAARAIAIAAVSGTWNMIHPDSRLRRAGLSRLRKLARACRWLGVPVITLCTGTRDPGDMWRHHPANDHPSAWKDLETTMSAAIRIARMHRLTLAIEPETGNVVNSPFKARRLLDTFKSPNLKIVMDPANLLRPEDLGHQREILAQAFALLGPDIILAHAKELGAEGQSGALAPGAGVLDWDHYLALLRSVNFKGPLILHGFAEADAVPSAIFVRGKIAAASNPAAQGTPSPPQPQT